MGRVAACRDAHQQTQARNRRPARSQDGVVSGRVHGLATAAQERRSGRQLVRTLRALAPSGGPLLIGIVVGLLAGAVLGSQFGHVSPHWQFDGKPLEYWVRALGAHDIETRRRAAYALGETDTLPRTGCSILVEHLGDDAEVREEVRGTLIRWVRAGKCLQETAATLSSSAPSEVRRLAADALRGGGEQARSVSGALLAALNDPVPNIRSIAAAALGASRDTSAVVQDALAQAASDPDADVRTSAIDALTALPASSRRLIRGARRAAHDPDPSARAAAMSVFKHVEVRQSDLRAVLIRALGDSSAEVRAAAATSLGWIPEAID